MLGQLAAISSDMAHLGLWQEADRPQWSAIFPPGDDPDPAIVKAIRQFAPNYVPLWVQRIYVSPTGDLRAYGYYAHGMHTYDPSETLDDAMDSLGPVAALLPLRGWKFRGGRIEVVDVLSSQWIDGSWQKDCNVPEPAEPYDWQAYHWMKGTHYRIQNTRIAQDQMRLIQKAKAMEMAALQAGAEQRKLANRDDRFQLLRAFGKATSSTAVAPSRGN